MAVSAEQKDRVRQLLAKENAQRRNTILSSVESFAKWIEVVVRIAIAIKDIIQLFQYFSAFF